MLSRGIMQLTVCKITMVTIVKSRNRWLEIS